MKSIMYHYVRQYDKDIPYLNFLNIKNFEKQIVYFKKKYKFFDCNNFDYFTGYEKIKNKIFLTFDDGLSCHYDYVFKILKKNKINGIFYIPTKPLIDNFLIISWKNQKDIESFIFLPARIISGEYPTSSDLCVK